MLQRAMTRRNCQTMDPLRRTIDLNQQLVLFPLGFPMELRSNDSRIQEAADVSWGGFVQRFDETPLDVRVIVDGSDRNELPPEPTFRAQGASTAIVADRFNFATFDYSKGFGCAWVQEPVAADAAFFRWFFLEAMVYCLLTEMHLTPLHAGCIAMDGRGVLLVGDSGAGKSTLAFSCVRRGWSFVSDDAVWMLRRCSDRSVLGLPHRARLRPDCAQYFPELAAYSASIGVNGKPTLDVSLQDFPAISSEPECNVAASVFLQRGEYERASLEPLDSEEALKRYQAALAIYDETPRREQLLSLKRLVQAPAYTLQYRDLESADDALRELLASQQGSRD